MSTHDLFGPSGMHRRQLCPGSAKMEVLFWDAPEAPSDEAQMGTKLHKAMAGEVVSDLSPADVEMLEWTKLRLESIRAELGLSQDQLQETHVERKFTYNLTMENVVEGTPDLVEVYGQPMAALIVEFKFGFLDVEEAPDNIQLAAQAVILGRSLASTVYVCVIEPRMRRHTIAKYSWREVRDVESVIADIMHEAKRFDAPLKASEAACRYCKAKGICPAYRQTMDLTPAGMPVDAFRRSLGALDVERLEEVMAAIKFANLIEPEAKAIVAERVRLGIMPGWEMENNGSTRTVEDVVTLFERINSRFPDITPSDFMQAMKPVLGSLETMIYREAKKSGKCTIKEAKAILAECLEGISTETEKAKSPVKKGKVITS